MKIEGFSDTISFVRTASAHKKDAFINNFLSKIEDSHDYIDEYIRSSEESTQFFESFVKAAEKADKFIESFEKSSAKSKEVLDAFAESQKALASQNDSLHDPYEESNTRAQIETYAFLDKTAGKGNIVDINA